MSACAVSLDLTRHLARIDADESKRASVERFAHGVTQSDYAEVGDLMCNNAALAAAVAKIALDAAPDRVAELLLKHAEASVAGWMEACR